jgi:hypothetical protein
MTKPKLPTGTWILAEIAIVVVGILIAFSLNSWWEGRAAAEREREHLSALRGDFEQNVQRLNGLARSQDLVSRASEELLLVTRGHASATPDSVDRLMSEVFSSDQFDPVMGAYENLVNSGGLAQIKDDSLRSALASFAARVDSRYAEDFATALYLEFNRDVMGRLGWAGAVLTQQFGLEGPEGGDRTGGWNQAVLDDPGFQDHLALRFVSQRGVAAMYRDLAEQAEVVLERAEALLR